MSALTPDCDPDLSNCGSPTGGGVTSTVVLLALLVGSVSLATGGAGSGVVAFLGGGTAVLSAMALLPRTMRLARRAGAGVAAHAHWAPRSRPAG
ncbi:hypothetical protein ACI8AG_07230 [Blastococcus sp. SYSU DS0552]